MPITKWFAHKILIPGLFIVFSSYLAAMFTNPEYSIPVAIYGLAILGAGSGVVAIVDSIIGIIKISSTVQKHANLNIETKELDFRETKQEKVILLVLDNKEWWLDADNVKILFTNMFQTEDNETGIVKQLCRQVSGKNYRLVWKKVSDQKSVAVKLARNETKELSFVETNKARNEFYVKIDPRGQQSNSDIVGGFPPGKYKIDLMVRGNMPKRVIFSTLRVSVFYKGSNQLYVSIDAT